ncbi:multisubunit sodium/proton antiporter MrpG subunit [Natranaerovirga pectinivora]|uniref:Multisubunit sodium/proton antiporter MrpG subunit n=1 Tax=Natranaerovirga pectinivora TaxID=682400 RepID=A0A4R3MPD2_9FIRM|nr:monovalent cation/H(+) antiporter subunit G [Natranaerovirga pectinivora]TCT15459.1 multisubunit sodium/proton antiporter MrpG subunit [Natranaerovirga pectinivora]
MSSILGHILIIIGMFFIIFGSISILLFKDLYARLLACAHIDTLGMIFIVLGIIFISPLSTLTIKKVLILVFTLCIDPVSTYAIGRSAYIRGERPTNKKHTNNKGEKP